MVSETPETIGYYLKGYLIFGAAIIDGFALGIAGLFALAGVARYLSGLPVIP
jgi:hypothetical protein